MGFFEKNEGKHAPSDSESQFDKAILSGAVWNTGAVIFTKGFSYIVLIILARFLFPESFGLMAMAVVFTGLIGAIGDLGLAAALIQRRRKHLSTIHFHTAFWASLAFNGLVFVFFALLIAPFAAWFYDEPLLRWLIAVLAVQACINALGIIPKVILTRDLQFQKLVLIEGIAVLGGGIGAIFMAMKGAGVWSLVMQSLLSAIIAIPFLWLTTSWRPRLSFSVTAFKEIFGYGFFDGLHRTTLYFTNNIDYLLIGKLLSAQVLGIYSLAFLLTDTVRQQIMAILNKIMFPVYSQLQDNLEEVKKHYLLVLRYNTLLVTPFMLLFIFYADPLIVLLFGDEWINAVFPLRAMALAAIIHAMGGTTDSVLKGIGKVGLLFRIYLLKTSFITLPAFVIGIYFWGINGAACAVVVHKLSSRFIYQYYMKKFISVKEYSVLQAILPSFYGTIASVSVFHIACFFSMPKENWYQVLLIAGASIAAFAMAGIYPVRREIRQALHII